jgi:TM2 domain-containing membrane protein YozV
MGANMGGAGGGQYGAPPADGGFGAPPNNASNNFGAPPGGPGGGGGGMDMGAPPGGPGYGGGGQYGAPPTPQGQDYGQQQQQQFNQMNPGMNPGMGGPMQPYGAGAPMMGGMPGMGMAAGPQKAWMTTLLLAIFAGGFGAHRFYTGYTVFGIIQLCTCGGAGFWTLYDIIMIVTNKYVDAQGRPLAK